MRLSCRGSLVVLLGITFCIGVAMVYFGIRFKGFRPVNRVEWLPAGEGISFSRSAMAFVEGFDVGGADGSAAAGVSIEMVLRSQSLDTSNFQYILSVHAGSDERQLLIGQWRQWLIVMNGDDYDGKKGLQKVYVDLGSDPARGVWLSIVSDGAGTRVYLDGRRVKFNPNLHLFFPGQGSGAWLVVGNSVYGRHAWQGAVMGMALYGYALGDETVRSRAAGWGAESGGFGLERDLSPVVFYRFERSADGRVKNLADDRFHLEIPEMLKILKKEFLGFPRVADLGRWAMVKDVMLNLAGFVPLGFMLCAVAGRFKGVWRRYDWMVAVGLAFVFSLSLEVVQAWIPSRDSSLLDLVMNTAGAGVGAAVASRCARVGRVC